MIGQSVVLKDGTPGMNTTTKAKWCGVTQQWICFGNPDERVRRREIAYNIIRYRETGKRAFLSLASHPRKNQDDEDFFHFVWDFTS